MPRIVPGAVQDRAGLGIGMMLMAYLLFSAIDTSVKWLVVAGLPAIQLGFVRYFGHVLISTVHISSGGARFERFATDRVGLVLLRGACLAGATLTNFIALRWLPLTVTSAIMFSAPILVSALSGPLLGERVGPWRWFAIILGFGGVLVVIRPFGEAFHPATLLIVFSALMMALYSILTRRLAGVVAAQTMQFYSGAIGTVLMAPLAIANWQNPATPVDWLLMLGLGFWGWSGHEVLTRAHSFAAANVLMPFSYSFLIYLTITSYLVFGHLPDLFTVLGSLVIVASGLVIWARERSPVAIQHTPGAPTGAGRVKSSGGREKR